MRVTRPAHADGRKRLSLGFHGSLQQEFTCKPLVDAAKRVFEESHLFSREVLGRTMSCILCYYEQVRGPRSIKSPLDSVSYHPRTPIASRVTI